MSSINHRATLTCSPVFVSRGINSKHFLGTNQWILPPSFLWATTAWALSSLLFSFMLKNLLPKLILWKCVCWSVGPRGLDSARESSPAGTAGCQSWREKCSDHVSRVKTGRPFLGFVCCLFFCLETAFHSTAQAGLRLTAVLVPESLRCRDYRDEWACPVQYHLFAKKIHLG